MTKADSVHSTPRTNTPIDTERRRFLAVAAGASVVSVGTLAVAAATPTAALSTPSEVDPIFAAIAGWRTAYQAHGDAITKQDHADCQFGFGSEEAFEADEQCEAACYTAHEAAWQLARTTPTTPAGVVAVLRLANKIEDGGMEWPDTDTVGREGWHYQLRASIAAAIEAIAGVQS
jgi:hypothetical protein